MTKVIPITEFGKALLVTEDLDPLYVMLRSAKLDPELLRRWCVAYWCFYSAGVCSQLASLPVKEFWDGMERYAGQSRGLRGRERRHFRGTQATQSIKELRDRYRRPGQMVEYVASTRKFEQVAQRVQEHRGFGPWIAWKIADMLDRNLEYPVDFSRANLAMYSEPSKGAELVYRCWGSPVEGSKSPVEYVVRRLTALFKEYKAPPVYDRPVNVQEVETILCKWKAHTTGHYSIGLDTREIRHGLHGWGPLAERLAGHLPQLRSGLLLEARGVH